MSSNLVSDAIEQYINSVTTEREPDGKIHPSSASLCARRAVYASRSDGKAEEFDQPTKRKFYIGHRIHEVVQRALEGYSGIQEFYAEPHVSDDETNLDGSVDAVIKKNGFYHVIEVKSIAKNSLRYGGMPKEHHKIQAKMYAYAIQKGGFTYEESGLTVSHAAVRVRSIIYAYLEKESLGVYEYDELFQPSDHGRIHVYLKDLNAYVEDGTALPARLPLTKAGKKPWPCNYCAFSDKCWNQDPATIPLGGL